MCGLQIFSHFIGCFFISIDLGKAQDRRKYWFELLQVSPVRDKFITEHIFILNKIIINSVYWDLKEQQQQNEYEKSLQIPNVDTFEPKAVRQVSISFCVVCSVCIHFCTQSTFSFPFKLCGKKIKILIINIMERWL